MNRAVAPHCDDSVLHAPSTCAVCDLFPDYQAARLAVGINFTGRHTEGLSRCPSELRRPLDKINAWPGNRPVTHGAHEEPPDDRVSGSS